MTRAIEAFKDPKSRPVAFFLACVALSLLSLLGSSLVATGNSAQVSQEASQPK